MVRQMQLIECNPCSLDGLILLVGPENKATALLISHFQRLETWCRKPGTAFTTEYKIPGTEVRTLVRTFMQHRCARCRAAKATKS
eukprot:717223-Amphidinium_carterae.1